MSNSYIHSKRKNYTARKIVRSLGVLYFVLLAASIAYLWCFAKDRFISTASFRISRQDASGGASLAQLGLPGLTDSGSGDSLMATGYIGSADLLLELEKEFHLSDHYSAMAPDYIFRMKPGSNLEERLDYYRKRISAHPDATAGMIVLTVDSFNAELSRRVAVRLLEKAENYVNEVNQKIADKQAGFVHQELEHASKNVEDTNHELVSLQNESSVINPEEAISGALKGIQDLKSELFRAEVELATLLRDSPGSPRIDMLRGQIRSLDELVAKEGAKLTGPEKDRLGKVLVRYKELLAKQDLLVRLRAGAELAVEKNRVDAISHSRFFTVMQAPYKPEDVGMPKRWYMTVTLLALGAIFFLMLRALTRSVFEGV